MHNPLSIEGKHIVIAGGASGIGRQCAVDFTKAGCHVALLDVNDEQLTVTKELCDPNVACTCHVCDLTDAEKTEKSVQDIIAQHGPMNGMLYCAGIEKTLPYNKLMSVDFERIYSVNVLGAVNLVKILTKKGNRGDNAKYVLIASIMSVVGRPGVSAYAASKGALVSLVKTLALELAPKGMTINCISPGTILTPLIQNMMESLTEEQREERKAGFPLGLGRPEDISNTAMFLLSDGARWITGQNIIVDGGYTSR